MNKRKARYKRLKRKMRIAANEFFIEEYEHATPTIYQARPYTCVVFDIFLYDVGKKEYIGFSKQNPIDEWSAEEGLNKATHRARLAFVDAVVRLNMNALRERGVLADYLDGDIPLSSVPYDDPEYYTSDSEKEDCASEILANAA